MNISWVLHVYSYVVFEHRCQSDSKITEYLLHLYYIAASIFFILSSPYATDFLFPLLFLAYKRKCELEKVLYYHLIIIVSMGI